MNNDMIVVFTFHPSIANRGSPETRESETEFETSNELIVGFLF